MRYPFRLILTLPSLLILLLAGVACARPPYTNVGNDELKTLLDQGVTLVDIRRPEEWRQTGIVKGSRLITLFDGNGRIRQDFFAKFDGLVGKNQPVALICRTGNRTRAASRLLTKKLGFKTVYNVRKGITYWIAKGNPVTDGKLMR